MPIKITFQKETQKISKIPSSYSTLVSKIVTIFKGKAPNPFILEYEDRDGETLHILDEDDYKAMLSNDLPHQLHTIKFNLLPIDPALAQHIDSQIRKASNKANGESASKEGPQKKFENKENQSSSGFLSMFNELLSEKLACFEQITTHTDKKNQETKITINFKRNENKKEGPSTRVEVTTAENPSRKERPKVQNLMGSFQSGDTPKNILQATKRGDQLILLIEWNKRPNGEIPINSEVSSSELQQYDQNFLKNYLQKKKKATTPSSTKEELPELKEKIKDISKEPAPKENSNDTHNDKISTDSSSTISKEPSMDTINTSSIKPSSTHIQSNKFSEDVPIT
jgi:PB1 domain